MSAWGTVPSPVEPRHSPCSSVETAVAPPTYAAYPDHACARAGLVGGPLERRKSRPRRIEPPLRAEVPVEKRVGLGTVAVVARADVEDRKGLVRSDDDGVGMFLEDLHRDALVPVVPLEDQLRACEVDVALVPGADLFDRQAGDMRTKTVGDDHPWPPKSS